MNCERCDSMWGEEATFRIRSDILNLKICGQCAKEASDLELMVKPLMNDCPSRHLGWKSQIKSTAN